MKITETGPTTRLKAIVEDALTPIRAAVIDLPSKDFFDNAIAKMTLEIEKKITEQLVLRDEKIIKFEEKIADL